MKITRRSYVVAIAVLFAQSSLAAEDGITGNLLYSQCDSKEQTTCVIFMAGLLAGVEYGAMSTNGKLPFCRPVGSTVGQMSDLFVKTLRDDPASRHLPAGVIAIRALTKAYPCSR